MRYSKAALQGANAAPEGSGRPVVAMPPNAGKGKCVTQPLPLPNRRKRATLPTCASPIGGSQSISRSFSLRRLTLELWGVLVLACVVGFLGPFGTYGHARLADRVGTWWLLLMGAYLLVRPAILLLRRFERTTELSDRAVVLWGTIACSVPLAAIWRAVGRNVFRELDGFAALLPFSLLCALAVLGVARWADIAERRARSVPGALPLAGPATPAEATQADTANEVERGEATPPPPLASRLPPSFAGPILALQSEDHYVRVHGPVGSAMLLMRLRDAVAEMGATPGAQVHRSWWVAKSGIAAAERSGRSWVIRLGNGGIVPVARESAERLQRSGVLPSRPEDGDARQIPPREHSAS
ncbi:MAG TPA: LytTR family DNA-binding domain-containing protein [Reyranella sp.]|nr:LytTR family DNA-binding domain-containing protein [Reyranella sp.]